MAIDLHYYKGDCTTLQAQRQTKHNFIQMIKGSRLWQTCQDPVFGNRCTADNTKVTCARVPAVIKRKKRSSGKLLPGHVCTWKVLFWGQRKNAIFGEGVKPLNCTFIFWFSTASLNDSFGLRGTLNKNQQRTPLLNVIMKVNAEWSYKLMP